MHSARLYRFAASGAFAVDLHEHGVINIAAESAFDCFQAPGMAES